MCLLCHNQHCLGCEAVAPAAQARVVPFKLPEPPDVYAPPEPKVRRLASGLLALAALAILAGLFLGIVMGVAGIVANLVRTAL